MRKVELDHLLENAVAKAIGVKLPHANLKVQRQGKKHTATHRPVRHAA